MNASATTARRARALACALAAVTVTPEQRAARTELALSLKTVALALDVLPEPPAGVLQYPSALQDELTHALQLAGPPSGIPAHVMTYVSRSPAVSPRCRSWGRRASGTSAASG